MKSDNSIFVVQLAIFAQSNIKILICTFYVFAPKVILLEIFYFVFYFLCFFCWILICSKWKKERKKEMNIVFSLHFLWLGFHVKYMLYFTISEIQLYNIQKLSLVIFCNIKFFFYLIWDFAAVLNFLKIFSLANK